MARIHYWELSNYNGGKLIGKWFDLDGLTKEEHLAELAEWLEELTEETGELCEEYIVGDTEDVPSDLVGEWSLSDEFFEIEEVVQSSGLDREIVEAGLSLGIPAESIGDAYYGAFESDTELAEDYMDQCGLLSSMPESLQVYFDYERFGRDLAHDFLEENGFYFNANW